MCRNSNTPIIRWFAELPSTNSAMAQDATDLPHGAVYVTDCQCAGRGQRGNSWEAEPFKNLTFSILLKPNAIRPANAFAISMLCAIATADTLTEILGREVLIKWPNDLYVNDYKLCGMLIENTFSGSNFSRCIIGIGINVNQTNFRSDAPNPVSMRQLTDVEYDLTDLLGKICTAILNAYSKYAQSPDLDALTADYRKHLWRGSGIYQWHDLRTGEILSAEIASIAPDGLLTLATEPPRTYAFKEISPVMSFPTK